MENDLEVGDRVFIVGDGRIGTILEFSRKGTYAHITFAYSRPLWALVHNLLKWEVPDA